MGNTSTYNMTRKLNMQVTIIDLILVRLFQIRETKNVVVVSNGAPTRARGPTSGSRPGGALGSQKDTGNTTPSKPPQNGLVHTRPGQIKLGTVVNFKRYNGTPIFSEHAGHYTSPSVQFKIHPIVIELRRSHGLPKMRDKFIHNPRVTDTCL